MDSCIFFVSLFLTCYQLTLLLSLFKLSFAGNGGRNPCRGSDWTKGRELLQTAFMQLMSWTYFQQIRTTGVELQWCWKVTRKNYDIKISGLKAKHEDVTFEQQHQRGSSKVLLTLSRRTSSLLLCVCWVCMSSLCFSFLIIVLVSACMYVCFMHETNCACVVFFLLDCMRAFNNLIPVIFMIQ